MDIWHNHEMSVIVRITVHDDKGMGTSVQDKIIPVFVFPLFREVTENTPLCLIRKDIGHPPWRPQCLHVSVSVSPFLCFTVSCNFSSTFCASLQVSHLSFGFLSRYAGWKVGIRGIPL